MSGSEEAGRTLNSVLGVHWARAPLYPGEPGEDVRLMTVPAVTLCGLRSMSKTDCTDPQLPLWVEGKPHEAGWDLACL